MPRPALVRRLQAGRTKRLVLLSAPAGYGKTTLLGQWLSALPSPARVAWLSLDGRDNDPARFLSYLVAAIQRAGILLTPDLAASLRAPQPPPLDTILTELAHELAALPSAPQLIVVFDDYHLIRAHPIHAGIEFLLTHGPEAILFVLAARSDPPLPVARLKSRGSLLELGQSDLAFRPAETACLFELALCLAPTSSESAALTDRTGGWAMGLRLATLALQRRLTPGERPDLTTFANELPGDQPQIFASLVEEVLAAQTPAVQTFLHQTSPLDRFCGPLCEAVCDHLGPGHSQGTLEALEKGNLLVTAIDADGRWFRYHQLFTEFVGTRLASSSPELARRTHQRASDWYAAARLPDEAIAHAVEAGDPDRTAALVERYGMTALMSGELITLLRWIESLPEGHIEGNASIAALYAWGLMLTGQLAAVEPRLQQAERALGDVDDELRGDISAIRAYMAAQAADTERTVEMGERALILLPDSQLGKRAVVHYVLGAAHLLAGDVAAAGSALAQAGAIGARGGNLHVALPAYSALVGILAQQGQLRRAQETAEQALAMALDQHGNPKPIAGGIISGLAELACEWNQLDQALMHAQHCVALGRRWGNQESLCHSLLSLAQVHLARSDLARAEAALAEAARAGRYVAATPLFQTQWRAAQAALWIAQDNLSSAARWAEQLDLQDLNPIYHAEALTLIRAQLALGRPQDALDETRPLVDQARQHHLNTVLIQALNLQAVALDQLGDRDRAMAVLAEALSLGFPQGYVRSYLDIGPDLIPLLRLSACLGDLGHYAKRLLDASASTAG